jgi:hypothetical protein
MDAIKAKARGEPKQIFELVLLVAKLLSQPHHVHKCNEILHMRKKAIK